MKFPLLLGYHGYPSKRKVFKVNTPARKQGIKRLARRSYRSLASSIVNYSPLSTNMVSEVARKIKAEMKDISSQRHNSFLLDSCEAVKHFSWDRVLHKLRNMMPTLMQLLTKLISNPLARKPLMCVLSSPLLKQRYPWLGLVQRAMSVLFFLLCSARSHWSLRILRSVPHNAI